MAYILVSLGRNRPSIELERPFEETKVLEVVKVVNSDRALSLDGFSTAFFRVCWEMIKEDKDIMHIFHEFHAHGMFKKSLNSTIITYKKNVLVLVMSKSIDLLTW